MSAPHIILDRLPSLCQKLSDLEFCLFFIETRCIYFLLYFLFYLIWALPEINVIVLLLLLRTCLPDVFLFCFCHFIIFCLRQCVSVC